MDFLTRVSPLLSTSLNVRDTINHICETRKIYLNITISITLLIATVNDVLIIIADKVLKAPLLIILVLFLVPPLLCQLQYEGVIPDPRKLLHIIEQSSLFPAY